MSDVWLTADQQAMLDGRHGATKQKMVRLLVDLAWSAGAQRLVDIESAHLSGVSPLTGGHGLRRLLADLADGTSAVAVPTTLNSAGCDATHFDEMGIAVPEFLEHHFEIVTAYQRMGVEATMSCTPYDRPGLDGTLQDVVPGPSAWAESNAIAFANSWTDLWTNRESGLSALAAAHIGATPEYGLLLADHRRPNIRVRVTAELVEPTGWSLLGDWIGRQVQPGWRLPFGPIPWIEGLPPDAPLLLRKALTAGVADHGSPMVLMRGWHELEVADVDWQGDLLFDQAALDGFLASLAPTHAVDLVLIGCPQASVEEIQATAELCEGVRIEGQRLWVFTSRENRAVADAQGWTATIEAAGGLVLQDTCPEVIPYDRARIRRVLTNSMKAEHYLQSGLNRLPTAVARLPECIAHAADPTLLPPSPPSSAESPALETRGSGHQTGKTWQDGPVELCGRGLPSQKAWRVEGVAMVTDVPITFLGFVNGDTGVIEEPGHPLDGRAIEDTVLIFPRGSGSSVAPYVLLGLLYTGNGPRAVVNTAVDQQTLPACSILSVPYGHSFDGDPCLAVNDGDRVEVVLEHGEVVLRVLERADR